MMVSNNTQRSTEGEMLRLLSHKIKNNTLKVRLTPNVSRAEIRGWDESHDALRVAVCSPPEKNKANEELVKMLKKILRKNVYIAKGLKSRDKIVAIEKEEFCRKSG